MYITGTKKSIHAQLGNILIYMQYMTMKTRSAIIPMDLATKKQLNIITIEPKSTATGADTSAHITESKNTTMPLSKSSEYPYNLLIDQNINQAAIKQKIGVIISSNLLKKFLIASLTCIKPAIIYCPLSCLCRNNFAFSVFFAPLREPNVFVFSQVLTEHPAFAFFLA